MPSTFNEACTRKDMIDPALARAGWDVHNPNQVGLEIPVDGFDPAAWQALLGRVAKTSRPQPPPRCPAVRRRQRLRPLP